MREQALFRFMDEVETRPLRCFFVGGLTNVPYSGLARYIPKFIEEMIPKKFKYWLMSGRWSERLEMQNAIGDILAIGYNIQAFHALKDNEGLLYLMDDERKAAACYHVDQGSVEDADFIVVDMTYSSTGTGQELERARQLGKPIIALIRERQRKWGTHEYRVLLENGSAEERDVLTGREGSSLMADGNPAIKGLVVYVPERENPLSHFIEKFGWWLETRQVKIPIFARMLKSAGRWMRNHFEPKNPRRSKFLEDFDAALHEVLGPLIGLQPRVITLLNPLLDEKYPEILDSMLEAPPTSVCEVGALPNEGEPLGIGERAELEEKTKILEGLLHYSPLKRNMEYTKISKIFPHVKKQHAEGTHERLRVSRVMSKRFSLQKMPQKQVLLRV